MVGGDERALQLRLTCLQDGMPLDIGLAPLGRNHILRLLNRLQWQWNALVYQSTTVWVDEVREGVGREAAPAAFANFCAF